MEFLVTIGGVVKSVLSVLPVVRKIYRAIRDRSRKPITGQLKDYLEAFLATKRYPKWDDQLTAPQVVRHSVIHYAPAETADPSAYATGLEVSAHWGKQETIPQFVDRLREWRQTAKSQSKNVFVLLGAPGSGKSSFAVQIAQFLASRRME